MGVDADEWLNEVTGRRQDSLVLLYAPPTEPAEEPDEDEVAVVPPPVPGADGGGWPELRRSASQ
eukprot:10470971-Prorocentrum_lima.AAC.1